LEVPPEEEEEEEDEEEEGEEVCLGLHSRAAVSGMSCYGATCITAPNLCIRAKCLEGLSSLVLPQLLSLMCCKFKQSRAMHDDPCR
jgi:hypothetical protein